MSSPVSTFSIKERQDDMPEEVAEVSGATAFRLRGTDGMVTPLLEGATTRLAKAADEVPVGLPTTVVAGATLR
jgi:hypothetical protein